MDHKSFICTPQVLKRGVALGSEIVRGFAARAIECPPQVRTGAFSTAIAQQLVRDELLCEPEIAGSRAAFRALAHHALLSLDRLVVHQLRPSVAELVRDLNLRVLPTAAPQLFRHPWIVEVRRPETGERLFGDTVCLAGHEFEGQTYLVGLSYPDHGQMVIWRPAWGTSEGLEADIPYCLDQDWELTLCGKDRGDWCRSAVRFAVLAGLLLEAQRAPTRIEAERPVPTAPRAFGGRSERKPSVWITRHVYLDEQRTRWRPRSDSSMDVDSSTIDGLHRETVRVCPHFKWQPCGTGGRERKWIFVDDYPSVRWVSDQPTRIVLGTRRESEGAQ